MAARRVRGGLGWLILLIAVWWPGVLPAQTDSPALTFFTSTADRLIRYTTAQWYAHDPVDYSNTFGGFTGGFSLTNIPVRINGQFVYTPAVNRLLQLSANLYEATTNTFYPAVYRPSFYVDPSSGNIFICGYNQILPPVTRGVTPLDEPITIAALRGGYTSGAETNAYANVFGVPWIIGARKYLLNFNQFYLQSLVQIARKIQVNRPRVEGYNNINSGNFSTNQMFIMSITNRIGYSFWNSYQTNYPGGLPTVCASDLCWMTLTNNMGGVFISAFTNVSFYTNLASAWPGANWNVNEAPTYRLAAPGSFFFSEGDFDLLQPSVYDLLSHALTPIAYGPIFNTNDTSLQNLDQFGLITSNWFQAYIVDNSNVVDYVQFSGPNSSQNLNNEMLDAYRGPNVAPYDMWITNLNFRGENYGLANQIYVSQTGTGYAPNSWRITGLVPPGTPDTLANEAAYFNSFFTGAAVDIGGQIYVNTNLSQQAPYMPTRTMSQISLWQANDPLVHYLSSDLNEVSPFTGPIKSDDPGTPSTEPIPFVSQNSIGQSTLTAIRDDRYQPWGDVNQLAFLPNIDTNAYNSAYRDPLVYSSDDWDFPTNFSPTPDWLGRIHRGTPWQTLYLKSSNILSFVNHFPPQSGSATWIDWSGDLTVFDATNYAPIADHALLTPLMELFNTNDIRTLISVNDPNPGDWLVTLDGLDILTNTTPYPFFDPSQLTFGDIILSSNSPTALALFNAIQAARQSMPNGNFITIGDLLSTPQLAEQSPFLDTSDTGETKYGISDEAYERIAAQLLFRVRADSFGSANFSGAGQATVQFSGTDGYAYTIQVSPDLVNWTTVSTNYPVNDAIQISVPTTASQQFYRSVLLP